MSHYFTPRLAYLSFILCLFFSSSLQSQSLVETTGFINTTKKVFPAVTYTFEVQGIPSSWDITNIKWQVGPNATIFINGNPTGSFHSGPSETHIDVQFDDLCTIGQQFVKVTIEGTDLKDPNDPDDDVPIEFDDEKKDLKLKAITTPTISGNLQIQECCLNPLNYSLSGYCDADEFDWTLPNNWAQNQQSDSPSPYVNITPDKQSGGNLQVTAKLKDHPIPGAYEKTASILITRTTPQINITSRPLIHSVLSVFTTLPTPPYAVPRNIYGIYHRDGRYWRKR